MSRIFPTGYGVVPVAIGLLLNGLAHQARAVDGVVLINQASVLSGNVTPGDAPGFPVTISQPGSYKLTSNLFVTGLNAVNVSAIEITANQVTLDLNGFTIFGAVGSVSGKGITTNQPAVGGSSITVNNGTVRDMGSDGIRLDSSCVIDRVRTLANGGDGINLTTGAHVLNSVSTDNRGDGIHIQTGVIAGNTVAENQGDGVEVEAGATVIDNMVERNHSVGFLDDGRGSGYGRNVFGGNWGANVASGFGKLTPLQIGPNACDGLLCP